MHKQAVNNIAYPWLKFIIIFRQDVSCFDSDDHTCYSLAFGVPAALMCVATIILIIGKPLYVFKPPQGNILTQVFGSIFVSGKKIDKTNKSVRLFQECQKLTNIIRVSGRNLHLNPCLPKMPATSALCTKTWSAKASANFCQTRFNLKII